MTAPQEPDLPKLAATSLQPYLSVIVLECVAADFVAELKRLTNVLVTLKRKVRGSSSKVTIIARGIGNGPPLPPPSGPFGEDAPAGVDAFVSQVVAPPAWAANDTADFLETNYHLTAWVSYGNLVAIHCDPSLGDSIQRWLDKSPRPPYRRIAPGVLHAALLPGEAKTLWLRGAHARRSTKADTKTISGMKLQDALSPFEDSSFGMGSARAEVVPDPQFASLTGSVGTTPRRSSVWLKATKSYQEFIDGIVDLLGVIQLCIANKRSIDRPYPWLAYEAQDLTSVAGAYELSVLSVADLQPPTDWPDEALEAASLLETAEIHVRPTLVTGPDFLLDVGLGGCIGGRLRCSVRQDDDKIRLAFGYDGQPSDPQSVKAVLGALEFTDLVTVHYQTGHAISAGRVWTSTIGASPFPNWRWMDFGGFDITREKPGATTPQAIHDAIGEPGETSLFSWVVREYSRSGWLTCDDGANEVADFVHFGGDGSLALIHVKAASTSSAKRPINVTRYETVASQASKNLVFLGTNQLVAALSRPAVQRPATWSMGVRVPDRAEMLEYLPMRAANAPLSVVIVQPQITKAAYDAAWVENQGSAHQMRVRLLGTLLNTARGASTGLGADMSVVAAE